MRLCRRSLGAEGSLKHDWPRAEKVGFSNAYPQTPGPLSNLHLPASASHHPTNTLHLLEEPSHVLIQPHFNLSCNFIIHELLLNVGEKY